MTTLYSTLLFIAGMLLGSALTLLGMKKTINSALDDGYALGFKHGREIEQETKQNYHQ